MSYQERYRTASFRGVPFFVDKDAFEGGRRNEPHEFPKRNQGLTEDMGRRLRIFPVDGYIIGDNHDLEAQALITALEADGPGLLVLPLKGSHSVIANGFSSTFERTEGRITKFAMSFVEAGSAISAPQILQDTQNLVRTAAASAASAVVTAMQARL